MNGISIIPTDTVYGIVGSARDPHIVERIYELRGRTRTKPCIVLIPDASGLGEFGIVPTQVEQKLIERYWPGPVTIAFSVADGTFTYLHRGTHSIAFRVPSRGDLRDLLRQRGPLIAPSANPEGREPAHTIEEARAYFGNAVTEYIDGGRLDGVPSTLVRVEHEKVHILRQGSTIIDESVLESKLRP